MHYKEKVEKGTCRAGNISLRVCAASLVSFLPRMDLKRPSKLNQLVKLKRTQLAKLLTNINKEGGKNK